VIKQERSRVLANSIVGQKAERRPGASEEWLAATKHDGAEVESILPKKSFAMLQISSPGFSDLEEL
jgi:hypothetical protein